MTAAEPGQTAAGCPFCGRIERGEYEAWTDDPSVVWFEPLNPVTPGHMLFVPVHHVTGASDPRNGAYEAGLAMEHASRWAPRNGVESFNLITSVGAPATQSVYHLHVHLVPRRPGDGLKLPWGGQPAALAAQERPAPAPDGKTGGQLAYEAAVRVMLSDVPADADGPDFAWDAIGSIERDSWEAAAQAVETQQVRLARESRDDQTARMLALAARLEESAAQTAPSRKSEIEREAAIHIRQALEPS